MVTRSTIKDWFVNHTKPIQKVMNTLDHTDVVFMPVMPSNGIAYRKKL